MANKHGDSSRLKKNRGFRKLKPADEEAIAKMDDLLKKAQPVSETKAEDNDDQKEP